MDVNFRRGITDLSCLEVAVEKNNKEIVSLLLQQPGIDLSAHFGFAFNLAVSLLSPPALRRLLSDFPELPELQNILTSILNSERMRMLEKVTRDQTPKRDIFNEAKTWKELKLARKRQKEAMEGLVRKNKEAEEEMSKEVRLRKEKVEKEFQDKIEALAREIKIMEDEKQKKVVQINLELVERQKALSEANHDELNKLAKKHKAENADMVEHILDNEAEVAEEDEEDVEAEDPAPAAPDCPICYELMSPPTRIFQCGAGHLVCGTCRPRLKVYQEPYFFSKRHHFYSGAVNFR